MNRKQRKQQVKFAKQAAALGDCSPLMALALEHYRLGDQASALDFCRKVIARQSRNTQALDLAAQLFLDQQKPGKAVRYLKSRVKITPRDFHSQYNLGTAYAATGQMREAADCQRKAIEIDPADADAHYNLANALHHLEHKNEAVIHFRHALELAPEHSAAATNLASSLLHLGHPDQALKACKQALQIEPGNRDAMAFNAIAATECGEADLAAELLNPELLVQATKIKLPSAYSNLEDFNAALTDHVLRHPTLTREPHNKSTRHGQQTAGLATNHQGPVSELINIIGEMLDDYLTAIRRDSAHPYAALIPKLTSIDVWGTVLDSQGHQAAHMHRSAWVSGVYYVQLPSEMRNSANGEAGWIEFGRPPDEFCCKQVHAVKTIKPMEGLMVMFPSYLYHRTIPFESTEQRISIAFDLLA